jgi:hypothetical protein
MDNSCNTFADILVFASAIAVDPLQNLLAAYAAVVARVARIVAVGRIEPVRSCRKVDSYKLSPDVDIQEKAALADTVAGVQSGVEENEEEGMMHSDRRRGEST